MDRGGIVLTLTGVHPLLGDVVAVVRLIGHDGAKRGCTTRLPACRWC